jgi:hypothetical protein
MEPNVITYSCRGVFSLRSWPLDDQMRKKGGLKIHKCVSSKVRVHCAKACTYWDSGECHFGNFEVRKARNAPTPREEKSRNIRG